MLGVARKYDLAITYVAMTVNDAADDVCTEVYLWPTHGDMEAGDVDFLADQRRLGRS